MPKVSILMPVRNAEQTARDSIESILTQSFRDFEFLICDDASSDQTRNVLRTIHDRRVHVYYNKKKRGVAGSLNRLLRVVQGEFICRMDADDISKKNRLREQVDFLEKHHDVGLIGSWFEEVDGDGLRHRTIRFPTSHKAIRRVLPRFNPIRHPTIMMRRSVFKKIRRYDESLEGAEDYDIVIRASTITRLANIPKFLLRYRVDGSSVSVTETQRILWSAVFARWKALRLGYFHWWEVAFFMKPLLSLLIPPILKRWIRRVG